VYYRLSLSYRQLNQPSYQDPFDDYKKRLAKKLARREANQNGTNVSKAPEKTVDDTTNWFGLKIGGEGTASVNGNTAGGGVGKYLNLKRPQNEGGAQGLDEPKKKRKLGFGDFEGW